MILPLDFKERLEGFAREGVEAVRAGVEAVARAQQRHDAKLATLRAAIDEGDASAVFEGDPFAEVRARHGLAGPSR
jgi:Arc/MetJ-type ribon-helix-helix transcriptional regulator